MSLPVIYFDEAGNTGQDLPNEDQPFFSLASVQVDEAIARDLISGLRVKDYAEIKFSKLKKSGAGRAALITLYNSELVTVQSIKALIYHKQFMITTEIVDLLVEPMAKASGLDLYDQGANIALSNIWHHTLPVFCGEDLYKKLQLAFVEMIRERTEEATEAFYGIITEMYLACSYEPARGDLGMLSATQIIAPDMLNSVDETAIDPAIPSFAQLCDSWGRQIGNFRAIHDDSLAVESQEGLLSLLLSSDEEEVEIGYDRRKSYLPLRAKSLTFQSSKAVPALQVADLIASGLVYWLKGITSGNPDRFQQQLDETPLKEIITALIWPSTDVSPEDLGTEERGGINAVDYTAEFIARKRREQRNQS